MEVHPVADDEVLIRLTFCTEHFNGTEFEAGAVSLEDLDNRGFSVDRPFLTPVKALKERIERQKTNKPDLRNSEVFSRLICEQVLALKDEDMLEESAFLIKATPVANHDTLPDNPGHTSILSAKKRKKSGLKRLRVHLICLMNDIVKYEDIGFVS